MNCLYARANSKFYLVLSDDNCPDLFTFLDTDNIKAVPYTYPSSLEDDEWFYHVLKKDEDEDEDEESDEDEKISDPLERLNRQIKTSLPTIDESDYQKILYIVYRKSGTDWFILQKIPNKSKVYGKKVLTFSEQAQVVTKPFIIINEEPDALYNITTNNLYFKNISRINNVFNNLNLLYREASKPEKQTFLNLPLLNVSSDFDIDKISMVNSKHIALVLSQYNSYDDAVKTELHSYMEQINDLSKDENGKYIINNDEDLRIFIYALQERYYTTFATKENRLAKSFIKK